MKKIVITGSIASGKSVVTEYLKELNYLIIDADKIAHEVVAPGTFGLKKIVDFFGSEILTEIGTLNRALLGRKIFNDDNLRLSLNQILHPLIFQEINRQIELAQQEKLSLVFVDIPLYFETKEAFNIEFDQVWVVYVDEQTQLQRLLLRDSIDEHLAIQKIKSQIPLEQKKEWADKVIDNSGPIEETKKQVRQLLGS